MKLIDFVFGLQKRYLFVICLLIVCKILIYFAAISVHPLDLSKDSKDVTWWNVIQSVENGQGFKSCDESYIPNCSITNQVSAMREPLPIVIYALVGKLTGNSFFAFQYFQLIFDLLILWGVYLLAREFGNKKFGIVAAFAWTFYLAVVRTEVHINGDLLAGVFVTWGVLCFIRSLKYNRLRDWLVFGLLFGFAVLSRSATIIIAFVFLSGCAILWLGKNKQFNIRMRELVVSSVALSLVIAPWVVRNMIVFHQPIIGTTLIGYNLFRHNAIVVGEIFPHYIGPNEAQQELDSLISRHPELTTPIDEAQVDRIYRQEAIKMIRAYPGEYAELVLYRFIPLWFNIGVLEQYGEVMTFLDYLVVLQQAVLLILFLFMIWRGKWLYRFIALGITLLMFSYMAVDSQLRYLLVIMPVVISVGVLSLGYLWPEYFLKPEEILSFGIATVLPSKYSA